MFQDKLVGPGDKLFDLEDGLFDLEHKLLASKIPAVADSNLHLHLDI